MPKESEITPFDGGSSSKSPTRPKSDRIRRVAHALRWAGLVGFWTQLVLGVVSSVTLALAIINQTERSNPGIGFSLFCAVCGLICLIVGIYITFRYGKMASQFSRSNSNPPKKSATIKMIQIAIITSIVGTIITIIGGETITGIVLTKTLAFDPAKVFNSQQNTEYVNSLDVFIIQACFSIILAHSTGLISSLWIYSRIDKISSN
jgi:ABC-type Fe3+ transport system permease subunit